MRRSLLSIVEIALLSGLILATRCANYGDVFAGGNVYFTDADCYARMMRVRMCLEQPGLVVRHHSFENFPSGTTPHTTAPLDYLIAFLTLVLKPITPRSVDLAGAIVSPTLGLLTGWFLWWWSRRMALPHRAALLLLFALSPGLVHATELGRPDHQSLLLGLVAIAVCAEWTLTWAKSKYWSLVCGAAWGLALWVSLYEPLMLLAIVVSAQLVFARKRFWARDRIVGWAAGAAIVLMAFAVEQRLPVWPGSTELFSRWAGTIGELRPVSLDDPIWLRWTGLLLILSPALLWLAVARTRTVPPFVAALLAASFAFTAWQARWGHFFALLFAIALPPMLSVIRNRIAGGLLMAICLFPILKDWDERLWPNEFELARRAERRAELLAWRETARQIDGPFLAPWWWSPAVAYWSRQPGIAGSSHGALAGIERSARFFLAAESEPARVILEQNKVAWVIAYDADRTIWNSALILGLAEPANALGRVLDRTPSQAPAFLEPVAQNSSSKLFRVRIFQEKTNFPR